MAERGRRAATQWGFATALAACMLLASSAGALDLRVQARSELTLQVRTAGTHLLISGDLRDDLGQPLPHREVRVQAVRRSDDRVVETRRVDTNRSGAYETRLEVPPGDYEVRATFAATPHVSAARAKGTVRVERVPVELEVSGPSLVRAGAGPVPIQVRATIEGEGVALSVEVRGPGASTERMRVDERGRGRFDVTNMLREGRNRIDVVAPGGPHRSTVSEQIAIRVAETIEVDAELEAVFERLQRGAAVTGRVRAGDEPVGDAAVEVQLVRAGEGDFEEHRGEGESEPVRESGRTDEDGYFHLFFSRGELADGEWSADVRVRPDVGSPWTRDVGVLEIDRTLSRMVVDGAAGLAVLAILFVAGRESWRVVREKLEKRARERRRTERRRRAFREEETLEPVSVPETLVETDGETVETRVRGQIWDPWRAEPVEGAQLEILDDEETVLASTTTGEQGTFEFSSLEEGDRELIVEAEYYVRGRFSFELPHDGSLDPCRFELVPVPLKIRRLYASLVEMAAGDDLWGDLSPREIRDTVRRVLGDAPPALEEGPDSKFSERVRAIASGRLEKVDSAREYLEAFTELVEETYFGPRPYGEATWQLARDIAVELREKMREQTDR